MWSLVVDEDYNSVKLLKLEEVDLTAHGPGLRVCYQTVFGSRCRNDHRPAAVTLAVWLLGNSDSNRSLC
jgi:hypothetical protein